MRDANRFEETIAHAATKIRHIFHDHCHTHLSGSLLGIPISAPRGTNHVGSPDFNAKKLPAAADLTESYSVIFASDKTTMFHMVEYGYAGEIRGEGSPDYEDWDQQTTAR